MAKRATHTWMAELMPGQSKTIPDTAANRMAVSYWKRRAQLPLRTRTLDHGQLLVECLDGTAPVSRIASPAMIPLPIDALSPRACAVLAEDLCEAGEGDRAAFFAALYADLMGEPLGEFLEGGGNRQ